MPCGQKNLAQSMLTHLQWMRTNHMQICMKDDVYNSLNLQQSSMFHISMSKVRFRDTCIRSCMALVVVKVTIFNNVSFRCISHSHHYVSEFVFLLTHSWWLIYTCCLTIVIRLVLTTIYFHCKCGMMLSLNQIAKITVSKYWFIAFNKVHKVLIKVQHHIQTQTWTQFWRP